MKNTNMGHANINKLGVIFTTIREISIMPNHDINNYYTKKRHICLPL